MFRPVDTLLINPFDENAMAQLALLIQRYIGKATHFTIDPETLFELGSYCAAHGFDRFKKVGTKLTYQNFIVVEAPPKVLQRGIWFHDSEYGAGWFLEMITAVKDKNLNLEQLLTQHRHLPDLYKIVVGREIPPPPQKVSQQ